MEVAEVGVVVEGMDDDAAAAVGDIGTSPAPALTPPAITAPLSKNRNRVAPHVLDEGVDAKMVEVKMVEEQSQEH